VGDSQRWLLACIDADRFFYRWGQQAVDLGWTNEDIFALHPSAPLARYDAMGLAWLLQGRTVVSVSRNVALLSDDLVYRRVGSLP
jgi:hypothetical protein